MCSSALDLCRGTFLSYSGVQGSERNSNVSPLKSLCMQCMHWGGHIHGIINEWGMLSFRAAHEIREISCDKLSCSQAQSSRHHESLAKRF
jgi:hypothetical protein